MNDQKTAELSNAMLRDTLGSLVLQGVMDRARIQTLEADCVALRGQLKAASVPDPRDRDSCREV